MMVVKKIMLLATVLFLTGCTVNYDLIYDGEDIYESSSFKFINEKITNENALEFADEYVCNNINCQEDYVDLYSHKVFVNNPNVEIRSSNLYNDKNISSSIMLHTCFDRVRIESDDKVLKLTTSKGFKCFDKFVQLENINVNLKTRYHLIESNHDIEKENTYSWIINEENAEDVQIEVEITKDKDYNIRQYLKYALLVVSIIIAAILGYILIKQLKYRKV